jgi:hypothetical protein
MEALTGDITPGTMEVVTANTAQDLLTGAASIEATGVPHTSNVALAAPFH